MSFPNPAVTAARHAMRAALGQLPEGSAVLLAVSGGSDSMALVGPALWAARGRVGVFTVTVDHGLRPESAAEAKAVDRFLSQRVDSSIATRVEPTGTDGPEGNARVARYERIAQVARMGGQLLEQHGGPAGPLPVLLGHTSNDQAETVLLGLGRGSGPRSIAGMRPHGFLPTTTDVPMIRPYLHLTRSQLRTVCRELDYPWVEDPTNELAGPWQAADGSPLRRSAIRHVALPALEQALGGGVVGALSRTAQMLRDDDDLLTTLANLLRQEVVVPAAEAPAPTLNPSAADFVVARPAAGTPAVVVDCKKLATHPRPLRTRLLRELAAEVTGRPGELVYGHVDGLDRLIVGADNKRRIDLPGANAYREANYLYFQPEEK